MIIKRDPDTIANYFEDSSNLKGGHAGSVVIPERLEELSRFLEKANAVKTPVSISGGGTGTVGARIPFGGSVISTERFNNIVAVSSDKMSAIVEAGVLVDDLKRSCEKKDLFYTFHPTERQAFVGGTIATNASGARSFKYGATRRYIRRLKMVLASGLVFDLKRGDQYLSRKESAIRLPGGAIINLPFPEYKMPDIKSSAGYFIKDGMDLVDLFIGQEGTLSVIVEAEIELCPKPAGIFGSFIFFRKEENAWNFSRSVKKDMKALSIEYFDSNTVHMLRGKNPNVPAQAKAAIFFEEEKKDGEGDEALAKRLEKAVAENGSSLDETWAAMTDKDLDKFNDLRYSIPETINDRVRKSGLRKLSTDIAVPETAFFEMMKYYKETLEGSGIEHAVFGHIGENHLHVNLLPRDEAGAEKSKNICLLFVKKAVSLGGTVSAEHGIGKTRHAYLEEMYGKRGIIEMARIKKAFDPNCILGLDNIFSRKMLEFV